MDLPSSVLRFDCDGAEDLLGTGTSSRCLMVGSVVCVVLRLLSRVVTIMVTKDRVLFRRR